MDKGFIKKLVPVGILVVVIICMALALGGTVRPFGRRIEPLKVTILKIGKADAIVLQTGKKTMVIDAGEEEDGEEVADLLIKQGLSRIDVLVITHFDKDHVGGADTLVEMMEIGKVIVPDYCGSSTEYFDFADALDEKGIVPEKLTKPERFTLGEASVLVEPPLSYDIPDGFVEFDNNFSLITTVTHGENRLLFMGDAEKQRIREWLSQESEQECDFLKVPHHGVYNKALKELFDAVRPQYAVICSSKKNPADTKTLELLKQYGARTLETRDGDVTVISDGVGLEIHQDLDPIGG